MRRKFIKKMVAIFLLMAVVFSPYIFISEEKSYSSLVMRDCLTAVERFAPTNNDLKVLEVISSIATREAAESRVLSSEAQALVKSDGYIPHLVGVFVTYRSNDKEYEFSCEYGSVFHHDSGGYKYIHLNRVTNDYLELKDFAIARWPELKLNYFERILSLFPIPAIMVSHF